MDTDNQSQVLMVRQPIFRQDLKIVAYELLHDASADGDGPFDADRASSQLLLNTYTSLCQDGALQRVPLFIPLSQSMLLKGDTPELPAKQVVLQIPADIKVGAILLENIRALVGQGYRLAVDNFTLQPQLIPLLKHMKIVKVDIRGLSAARLSQLAKTLSRAGVTPLAQHIQNFDDLSQCKKSGFKLFQGPFISRPVVVKGKQLPSSSVAILQLVQELQRASTTANEVEALIQLDPVLTYRILRVVNSAAYSIPNQIESLSQAVVLLGLDQVRKWATLIALSSQDDKPEELSRNLLVRGRFCQLVAEQECILNPDSCFMVGVMSQLDALMGMEMDELLRQIPLDDEIKAAIAHHQGPLGKLLEQIMQYEQGDFEALKEADMSPIFLEAAYRHSLSWAKNAMETLAKSG
ncbi:MAG: HDOD domain-containing protein [Halopseudomonas sp.]